MLISPQSDKRHINIINAITLNITAINAKIPEGETAKCPLLITVAAAIVIMENNSEKVIPTPMYWLVLI